MNFHWKSWIPPGSWTSFRSGLMSIWIFYHDRDMHKLYQRFLYLFYPKLCYNQNISINVYVMLKVFPSLIVLLKYNTTLLQYYNATLYLPKASLHYILMLWISLTHSLKASQATNTVLKFAQLLYIWHTYNNFRSQTKAK